MTAWTFDTRSLRTVFDGRYKFTRYFVPLQHDRPQTVDEVYGRNDIGLFDLLTDPQEAANLAATENEHQDLVLAPTDLTNNYRLADWLLVPNAAPLVMM